MSTLLIGLLVAEHILGAVGIFVLAWWGIQKQIKKEIDIFDLTRARPRVSKSTIAILLLIAAVWPILVITYILGTIFFLVTIKTLLTWDNIRNHIQLSFRRR